MAASDRSTDRLAQIYFIFKLYRCSCYSPRTSFQVIGGGRSPRRPGFLRSGGGAGPDRRRCELFKRPSFPTFSSHAGQQAVCLPSSTNEGLIEVQRRDQTGISDLVGPTRRCHRGIREFAPSGSYGLITTVVAEGFLATKAERMHDREIIEGEETHIIRCGEICMFMPHP